MISISKIIFSGFLICILTSCSNKEKVLVKTFLEIGSKKIELQNDQTVSQLRQEIQTIVEKNWDKNNETKTDWCKVYSIFDDKERSLKFKNKLVFTNTISTTTFRIMKTEAGKIVAEELIGKNNIRQGNSVSWTENKVDRRMFKMLLEQILNNSILEPLIKI